MPTGFSYTTSATTSATTVLVDSVWAGWIQQTSVTGSLTSSFWHNAGASSTTTITYHRADPVVRPVETEEERAASAARQAERQAVEDAARELLVSLLSPEQRAELDEHYRVTVLTPAGHRYRIGCGGGHVGNVTLLDGDRRVAALCCHSSGSLPSWDHFAAQLLALTADEESFVGTANVHHTYETLPDWFTGMRRAWRAERQHDRVDGLDVYAVAPLAA